MLKIRDLTAIEECGIYDATVYRVKQDCIHDHDYLRGVVELFVDGLDINEKLDVIAGDDEFVEELVIETLGFNPFEEG